MANPRDSERIVGEVFAAYRGLSVAPPARRRDEPAEAYRLRCSREIAGLVPGKALSGVSAIPDARIRESLTLQAAARLRPADFRGQPLRAITRQEGGHEVTQFTGDCMGAWGDFHRPARRMARLRGPSHFEKQARENEERNVLRAYRRGELKVPNDASSC